MTRILINFSNFFTDPMRGGVQRVYDNLAQFLKGNPDYQMYAITQQPCDFDDKSSYQGVYVTQCNPLDLSALAAEFQAMIDEWKIDFLISPFSSPADINLYTMLHEVKIIHHWHNIPTALYSVTEWLPKNIRLTKFGRWIGLHKNLVHRRPHFRAINRDAAQVLLSEGFRSDIMRLYPFDNDKIFAIPNPFLIDKSFDLSHTPKEKAFLYVGRITQSQKRFSDILSIWSKLQDRLPDWRLDIVGDGPEKAEFEAKAKQMGLERITFFGFKDPKDYYTKSRNLLMTSNFEGFSMVLVEAMQYGCVPFAYNSFAALPDIIDNGTNGFIIPPFKLDQYVETLYQYAVSTDGYKKGIQQAAVAKSKTFDVAEVWKRWVALFNKLNSNK